MSTAEHSDPLPQIIPGQIVGGKWKVVAPIGRGGMGAVFEGQNISIGKKVALKFIDAEFARQPDVASRFQREAEAASLVESAHIVHIFDSGTTESGIPYIVMELLRGEDLRARLRRMGRLPKEEAVHIVAQMLRGLHRAHQAGIVHRDLKPDNIFLVDRDDDPLFAKIVDFGISKVARRPGVDTSTLTRQGVVLGTPFYMSPEQAQALPSLDARTDLWSAGAILHECLAGCPPHRGDTYEQIIISICTTDAPPLRTIDHTIPESLADVVHRALARDPNRRFQNAKEMLDSLTATGFGPHPFGTATPRTVSAAAGSQAGSDEATSPEAPGGRTRVSWTMREPRPAIGSGTGPTDGRMARARTVRRTGLLLLGGAVTLAAYVLTSGILRSRRAERQAAAHYAAIASASAAVPVPSANDSTTSDIRSATDVSGHATVAPPAATSKLRKQVNVATTPSTASGAQAKTTAAPSASPAKTAGVAGGLQIKTNYP